MDGGNAAETQVTALLVHGAWHGPWCWEPLAPKLAEMGIRINAIELPMETFGDDVQTLRSAVRDAKVDGPVCVVGHSYGGAVVNAGAHDADRLIYVAAMSPDKGESVFDSLGPALAAVPGLELSGGSLSVARESLSVFYDRCPAPTLEWAFERLRPIDARCATETLDVEPAWRSVNSTYVVSKFDRAVPPSYQFAAAAAMDATVVLDADHSPFSSATDDLAAVIQKQCIDLSNGNASGQ